MNTLLWPNPCTVTGVTCYIFVIKLNFKVYDLDKKYPLISMLINEGH